MDVYVNRKKLGTDMCSFTFFHLFIFLRNTKPSYCIIEIDEMANPTSNKTQTIIYFIYVPHKTHMGRFMKLSQSDMNV